MTTPTATVTYGYPKLLMQLEMEYSDGATDVIVSDETWRLTTCGPILANNEYDGEEYDARLEMDGWDRSGFDDSAWPNAECVDKPSGVLSAQMIEPIRVVERIAPVSMTAMDSGAVIVDMGQNMVGWCRLSVAGPAGAQVRLRHAETLRPDGMLYVDNLRGAKATDVYILKGVGTETWEPRFVYHGFRYVEVSGFPGELTEAGIEGCVVHDDMARSGSFSCSNPLLNRIHGNIFWGVKGNYRSIPTDCP